MAYNFSGKYARCPIVTEELFQSETLKGDLNNLVQLLSSQEATLN